MIPRLSFLAFLAPALISCAPAGKLQIRQDDGETLAGGVTPTAVEDWTYEGCYTDDINRRTLPFVVALNEGNTLEACSSICAEFGYESAGLEFSIECFCGDASDIVISGAQKVDDSECNMPCAGEPTRMCGGSNRISHYTYTGATPITRFETAEGAAAGEYRFLIGAPIVPLIATVGINGKVVFLEKARETSLDKNTTGAYELDLAKLDVFNEAWREMHTESDIFCSAGLTLPDKAGRQLTVGGWSNADARGVRTYLPDGSPGVVGVNDWQENVNEVSLLVQRWYGTAMIMANGSILVMGGQVGVDGDPSPTLELLPATGQLIELEFLRRTNPLNLYPYLAQLPSGGIFVGYHNEGRVLDETTFAVRKELPNIPGIVGKVGGRTYPHSGAMTLLPQYAPYTDPLTVMICGGSTPEGRTGIDNCVSIQPDVEEHKWQIERMPSRRVMPLIVALPDGTHLILGGADNGVGGFNGAASDPNNQAVLYDSRKPVGQRFTRMASTPVPRMYHSEAVLLQDGRVLVSGSDPQDARYPQEYRIETFNPPYITSGAPRPTFEIATKDWAYDDVLLFAVKATSNNIKVSLVAAESSTHNNNMGQRILFPEVLCVGGTCSVTAPPNASICPPGWYQMFVLDNDIPSERSIWVRIGNDPGALGDWPPFPDFDRPGV